MVLHIEREIFQTSRMSELGCNSSLGHLRGYTSDYGYQLASKDSKQIQTLGMDQEFRQTSLKNVQYNQIIV